MDFQIRKLIKKVSFARTINFAVKDLRSKAKIRRLIKQRGQLSVEIGAGAKRSKGEWITLDLSKFCDIS